MPLAALGTRVELWAVGAGAAAWDRSTWDSGLWSTPAWQDVTPESLSANLDWGTDRVVGVLSVAAAGRIGITTYDPARILDPANQASPYWSALRPGAPFRVTYQGQVVRSGFLDSVTYSQASDTGRLDGSDGIALLVQARFLVADMAGAPTTLRALARWIVAAKSLPLAVEPDATDAPETLVNGSFETVDASALPTSWVFFPDGTGCAAIPSSDAQAPGTRVLDVSSVNVAVGPTIYQNVAGLTPGQVYGYSTWSARVAGTGTYSLQVVDPGNGNAQLALTALPTGTAMVRTYGTFTAPASGQAALRYVAGTTALGTDWHFDMASLAGQALPLVPVSPPPTTPTTAWDWLVLAATDTLTAVWVDPYGVIRFRAYGDPRDQGLTLGGADGIPVADVSVTASADGVWNRASCARPAGGAAAVASDTASIAQFGERLVSRDRPAPDPDTWVQSVILDRAFASMDWKPSTVRLQTVQDLTDLVGAGMVDMVRIAVDSAVPPISALGRLLGVNLIVTWADGWSAHVDAYVPSTDWRNDQVPPPVIPPVVPPTTQRVVRTYNATMDSRVSKTSGGSNYGAGTAGQIPVGSWAGWQNRGLFQFAGVPWSDVAKVVSARVLVTTSTQVNVGFGSSPKVTLRRITGTWGEGSLSSPGSGNAVVYPGPATTSTGAKSTAVTRSQSVRVGLDCTAIAQAWAPPAAGGSGAPFLGIAMYSAGETNDAYTTEFLSRETGSSGSRPQLELTLDVLV